MAKAAKKSKSPKKTSTKTRTAKKAAPKRPTPKRATAAKKAPASKAAPKKKASPKKASAKAAPKKTATQKPSAKAAPTKKPSLLPKRPPPSRPSAETPRRRSAGRAGREAKAFLPDPTEIGHRRVRDDLAEELGEEFLSAATSGEAVDDARDGVVPEEDGGPFITTSATSQFGHAPDESNPEDAEREPFPTTRSERGR